MTPELMLSATSRRLGSWASTTAWVLSRSASSARSSSSTRGSGCRAALAPVRSTTVLAMEPRNLKAVYVGGRLVSADGGVSTNPLAEEASAKVHELPRRRVRCATHW